MDIPTPPPPLPNAPSGPTGTNRLWAVLSHLSYFLGVGLLLPLVVYLVMKSESEYVAENAREALNFHLSLVIYFACCIPLIFFIIGIPAMILLSIVGMVLAIIAAVKAADGGCYRYPMILRLVSGKNLYAK